MNATTYITPKGLPRAAAAAGLALAVLIKTKTATWAEGIEKAAADGQWPMPIVQLDEDQIDLLDEHREALRLLRTDGARKTLVTLAACSDCAAAWLLSAGAPPTRCNLTDGCGGKPVKATAAKRAPEPS